MEMLPRYGNRSFKNYIFLLKTPFDHSFSCAFWSFFCKLNLIILLQAPFHGDKSKLERSYISIANCRSALASLQRSEILKLSLTDIFVPEWCLFKFYCGIGHSIITSFFYKHHFIILLKTPYNHSVASNIWCWFKQAPFHLDITKLQRSYISIANCRSALASLQRSEIWKLSL